jgi:hypothetical protein
VSLLADRLAVLAAELAAVPGVLVAVTGGVDDLRAGVLPGIRAAAHRWGPPLGPTAGAHRRPTSRLPACLGSAPSMPVTTSSTRRQPTPLAARVAAISAATAPSEVPAVCTSTWPTGGGGAPTQATPATASTCDGGQRCRTAAAGGPVHVQLGEAPVSGAAARSRLPHEGQSRAPVVSVRSELGRMRP